MSSDDTTDETRKHTGGGDVRAARRAQREAERAARAQAKADAARRRAMEAARAGGLFEGMEAMPRTEQAGESPEQAGSATGAGSAATGTTAATGSGGTAPTGAATPGTAATGAAGTATTPDTVPPSTSTAGTSEREPMDPARARKLTLILAAASVVLLVLAGLATWQYVEAKDATAVEQQIAEAPAQATDAAREVATQMFTYDHRTVDADLAAVREKLTEPALTEFVEQSMPTVASAAKQQEAAVYATVAAAAPQEVVDDDHVTVLVMLNRMVSTKESPEAASSASRLSLKMERVDGTWKMAEIEAL